MSGSPKTAAAAVAFSALARARRSCPRFLPNEPAIPTNVLTDILDCTIVRGCHQRLRKACASKVPLILYFSFLVVVADNLVAHGRVLVFCFVYSYSYI